MKIKCSRRGCKKIFERNVPWKKYCSNICRQIAWAVKKVTPQKTAKIAILAFLVSRVVF